MRHGVGEAGPLQAFVVVLAWGERMSTAPRMDEVAPGEADARRGACGTIEGSVRGTAPPQLRSLARRASGRSEMQVRQSQASAATTTSDIDP